MSYRFKNVDIYFGVGDIFATNADAICISTSQSFDLSFGAGKALLRTVGNTLDSVLAVEKQKVTQSTEIVIIDGGSILNNKKIMFAFLRKNDAGLLYEVYERIFNRAIQEQFKSLALTAIGTGGFNLPLSFGATCAFNAFNRINSFGSLEKIYFTDISKKTITEYEMKFRQLFRGSEDVIFDDSDMEVDGNEDEEDNIESTSMTILTDNDRKCAVKLKLCRHIFHQECINEAFKMRPRCPLCLKIYVTTVGPQPPGGSMVSSIIPGRIPGFPNANGIIQIKYKIPSGIQSEQHISPGFPYIGVTRFAYLPNTEEGAKCLELLKVAFQMRLTFTVSDSYTTGKRNICVWNGIHHKTSRVGGAYGYPDPTYLSRLQSELSDIGVTEELLR